MSELEKIYEKCLVTGSIREKVEVDLELIKSIVKVSNFGLEFIKKKSKSIKKQSHEWTFVFREYYETLRGLIEAYILFDKIKAENHQCKFAYICVKHNYLKLDWSFLETIRLKRNAINYRGQLLNHADWNMLEIQFNLHINRLKDEIVKKIEQIK